jgi:hypothetical protein
MSVDTNSWSKHSDQVWEEDDDDDDAELGFGFFFPPQFCEVGGLAIVTRDLAKLFG